MAISLSRLANEEFVAPGRSGCPGCPAVMGARLAMKVLGKDTIMVNATGCMVANYGYCGAPLFPFIHSLFENAGALASGVESGLRALGKPDVNVVVYAGDGGTVDIGLQALSGAVERGHRLVYICYDNEGYMNTGVQRSGSTPPWASTTTMPEGRRDWQKGSIYAARKDMVRIMAAHDIPYAATASVGYPQDYVRKVEKAANADGPAYIHLLTPCIVGWGFPEAMGPKLARLAVDTLAFPLYEVEDGHRYRITVRPSRPKPVAEYLGLQSRFRQLGDDDGIIEIIEKQLKRRWAHLQDLAALAGPGKEPGE
ncbi:MAG: thiamine pyrophosphate-dependent enzyme [Bacillota bacterium]